MSTPVQFCLAISIGYKYIGSTLYQQSFHLLHVSIPEMSILSTPVHPRVTLTSMGFPDVY